MLVLSATRQQPPHQHQSLGQFLSWSRSAISGACSMTNRAERLVYVKVLDSNIPSRTSRLRSFSVKCMCCCRRPQQRLTTVTHPPVPPDQPMDRCRDTGRCYRGSGPLQGSALLTFSVCICFFLTLRAACCRESRAAVYSSCTAWMRPW